MGVFQNNLMGAAAAAASASTDFYSYQIANSLRGSAAGDTTLKFTAGTPTSTTKMTMSFWVKRHTPDSTDAGANNVFTTGTGGGNYFYIAYNATLTMENSGGNQGTGYLLTEEKYRDPGAWYHVILRIDTSQSTQFDRIRVYANGQQLGVDEAWRNQTMITNTAEDETFSYLNADGLVQSFCGLSGKGHGTEGADLSLADVMFFDGQSYYSELGETKNGVWIPKDPSGLTFGNNGYWLKFESSGDLGNDSSGNNNDFTVANFAAHDQLLDSPTFNSNSNGGNFCTMNPLNSGSNNTFSEGNLKVTNTSGGCSALGTMSLVTGHKWYFEGKVTGSGNNWIGIIEENGYTNSANTNSSIAGSSGFNNYLYGYNGSIYYGANSTATGATITTNDIIGVLVDLESATNTIQFYKNGAAQGSAFNLTGTGINYTPMSDRGSSTGNGFWFNFGQEGTFGTGSGGGNSDVNGYGSFYYDDGASAKAICTGNLPVADAVDPAQTEDDIPSKLFGTLQYTGNGSERTIDTSFQIDKSWARSTVQGQDWYVLDTSRGYFGASSNNYYTKSNSNGVQAQLPQYNFKSQSGADYVLTGGTWFNSGSSPVLNFGWRANGGTTSAGSGDLTSQHQVDPSGGFSIVTAVGDGGSGDKTVSHGLSAAPTCIISKNLDSTYNWDTYWAEGLTASTYGLRLNSGDAQLSGRWGTVNSSIMTCKDNYTWAGTDNYIYYCFTDIEGYIKTGVYVGNANTDGPFVYTGFKPAWLMVRYVGSGESWVVSNNLRSPFNPVERNIRMNSSNAESDSSTFEIDYLSNGFKARTTWEGYNGSGYNIVYLAFAENPFKYATAR